MTESFEQAWERVAVPKDGKFVSMELRPLLQRAYESLITSSIDLNEIKISLENLLSFLATDAGRTTANCYATDLFFYLSDWDDEVGWESLPEPLTILIGDLGGALHDTVSHPEIAKNFDSLPEQLLERIKQWKPEY